MTVVDILLTIRKRCVIKQTWCKSDFGSVVSFYKSDLKGIPFSRILLRIKIKETPFNDKITTTINNRSNQDVNVSKMIHKLQPTNLTNYTMTMHVNHATPVIISCISNPVALTAIRTCEYQIYHLLNVLTKKLQSNYSTITLGNQLFVVILTTVSDFLCTVNLLSHHNAHEHMREDKP